MKLPALIHGRFKDVRPRVRKMISAYRKGARWSDLAGDMLETSEVSGLIVLEGPSSMLDDADHFHCFATTRLVHEAVMKEQLPGSVYRAIAEESFASHGGVLGLLGQDGRGFPQPDQYADFLRAFLRCWDDFAAEGKRYTTGSRDNIRELWAIPTSIGYVLGQMGIPLPELRARETADDLLRLIHRALGDRGA